jgi:hypothetical protein
MTFTGRAWCKRILAISAIKTKLQSFRCQLIRRRKKIKQLSLCVRAARREFFPRRAAAVRKVRR